MGNIVEILRDIRVTFLQNFAWRRGYATPRNRVKTISRWRRSKTVLGIGSKLPSFEIVGVKPGFEVQDEKDSKDRDAVVLGGSTDNEFCKLAWRRANKECIGCRWRA